MPILPLHYFDPYYATMGVMHYPDDERRARALTLRRMAPQVAQEIEAGKTLPPMLHSEIAAHANVDLGDRDDRYWEGTATGELLKVLLALYNTDPALASWNNAIAIAEKVAAQNRAKESRAVQWKAKKQFMSVAHLWAAWCIRDKCLRELPDVDYQFADDIQSFLAEAEMLRLWGQTWRPARGKSEPPLPDAVWRVGDDWTPPVRKPGWPQTGGFPHLILDGALIADLRPAGRPRLSS